MDFGCFGRILGFSGSCVLRGGFSFPGFFGFTLSGFGFWGFGFCVWVVGLGLALFGLRGFEFMVSGLGFPALFSVVDLSGFCF